MSDLIFKSQTYNIIGACMSVHCELGSGFLEAVYQEALEEEFKIRNIPFIREAQLIISYKGKRLHKTYQADFICYDNIIVEVKAISELSSLHKAQVINYLKATNLPVAILVNFGQHSLQHKRILNL